MTRLFLAAFLCLVAFTSCKKSPEKTQPASKNDTLAGYVISGLPDTVVMYTDDNVVMTFTFLPKPQKQEELSLSVNSLPEGLTMDIEHKTGIPLFSTKITVTSINVQPGFYVVQFEAKSVTGSKNIPIVFKIIPFCGKLLEGVYINHEAFATGSQIYFDTTLETTVLSNGKNVLFIKNLYYDGAFQQETDLVISLDCQKDSMRFNTHYNTGYYNGDTIFLKLKFSVEPGPPIYDYVNCTMVRK